MKRRTVWIIASALIVVVILGAAAWLLLPRDADESRSAEGRSAEILTASEAMTIAQERLDEHLETCIEPNAVIPAQCGMTIPWGADFSSVTGIRYRIEQAPVLTFTPPTFRADGGILVATVTGTGLDGAARSLTYRTENWMLRGDAVITRDDVELEAW